jgi:hypothetical protein
MVAEPRQVERAPAGRLREVDELGLAPGDADQQPLVSALAGVELDHAPQPGQPGALVLAGVTGQHRGQHVVVLVGQGAAEQHVGGKQQRRGAHREEARVPQPEAQGQGVPEGVTPP